MKKYWFYILSALVLLPPVEVYAQDATIIAQELDDIREDIKIIQRRLYNNGSDESDAVVQLGRLDEQVRITSGRMEELEYKIKQLDEKIDMINKDIDVRMNLLEGKKINASASNNVVDNSPKFAAPVAGNAPQAIVGGAISKSDELKPVKGTTAPEIYQAGLEALKAGRHDEAQKAFAKILDKYPSDKLAGNAQYWLGETYYARKEYDQSAVAFAKGYQQYKNGTKAPDSLLKLGMSMQALGKNKEACTAYKSVNKEFPKAEKNLKNKAEDLKKKLGCK
ncbi:MAG: tol-pal system protein YbgF [Alphaproteobacteria bacterium]|nr:tol-pal system protein YbgF [Alphaproteobacteria bacterium]